MITPLDSYFADQAGRPRTHAELRADDARSAELSASISRGRAALMRIVNCRLGRRPSAEPAACVQGSSSAP